MKITKANIAIAKSLRNLLELTFRDTYSTQNTSENIEQHVASKFSLEVIIQELQDTSFQYFVISEKEVLIGFAKLVLNNPCEGIIQKNLEIERFYIHPAHKGEGLGAKLMDFCTNWAAEQGFETVWLGVWEHNPAAIAFYSKMCFSLFGSHVFTVGDEDQTDLILIKELIVHHK